MKITGTLRGDLRITHPSHWRCDCGRYATHIAGFQQVRQHHGTEQLLLCPRCTDLYMREEPNPTVRPIVEEDYAVFKDRTAKGEVPMKDEPVIDWEFLSAEDRRTVTAQCIEQMCGPSPLQWDENRPLGMPVYRTIIRFLKVDTWEEVLHTCGWHKPMHRLPQNRLCSHEEMIDTISDVMLEIKEAEERRGLTVIPRGVIVQNGKVREVWEIR
mgnify:FL=1